MRRPRRLVLLVPALALALAACGSTVQVGDEALSQSGGLAQPGDSLEDATAAGPGAVVPGAGTGAGSGSLGSTSGGSGQPATGGGSTPGTNQPSAPESGLGGADGRGPIEVGITYTGNGEAANSALGASAITRGNEKAAGKAVIDEINDTGGINGRKLEAVFFEYEAASSQTLAQQDQNACSHFTEDHNIAVLLGGGGEVLDACMLKAGVLSISSGVIISPDKVTLEGLPNFFQLGTMSQDRMMADQVTTLQRLDYFSGWNNLTGQPAATPAKIGILSLNTPDWKRPLESVLLPGLARAGHPVDPANVYSVRAASSNEELAGTVADVKNATLRFQSEGVTHVIMLDATALLTILFAQNAKQQQYYPRLGANSATGMQAVYDAGVVENNQLRGAVGLGWLPNIDLSASASAKYANSATKRCLEVMKRRTGQTFTSTNAAGLAISKCDMADLMRLALTNAGSNLSLATASAAIESLGGSYQSPFLPKTFFGRGRHDAAQMGFDMEWDTGCTCTKYVGSHTVP